MGEVHKKMGRQSSCLCFHREDHKIFTVTLGLLPSVHAPLQYTFPLLPIPWTPWGERGSEDPYSAKRESPARWDPGGLQEHTVVAGQDGRGFGELGCGLLGGHQDPGPAPAAAPGTQAQPLAISEDW